MGSLEQNAVYNVADPNGNNENQTEDCSLSVYRGEVLYHMLHIVEDV